MANKIVKSPYLKNFNILNNLIGFELIKRKVVLNKPRYVGASILEFSKYFVYNFYYNFWMKMKKKYGYKIEFIGGDTDSMIIKIGNVPKGTNMNDILKKEGKDWIDFSNYPENHPNYDTTKKGLNGFWKDETEGVPIREVVFLRSKLYNIQK